MKIAQLNSNQVPTNRKSNNAIYSHVGALSDEFVRRDHDVTLFGASNSESLAKLVSSFNDGDLVSSSLPDDIKAHYTRLLIAKCYEKKEYDIIHSHFTLLSSYHAHSVETPTVISVHSPIREEIKPFLKYYKNLKYISFSLAQRKQLPELNWYANIYHGVDTKFFAYNETPKNYFLFLGRITQDKGVHLAIEAAKRVGIEFIIAGKSYPNEGYWHKEIEQNIDGTIIRYVGQKNLDEKMELLKNAKALIFPSQCEEAFGYSMIEALSCGTPVIGWNSGSIPEIVKHGKTGFIVNSVDELVDAMKKVDTISRKDCRNRAETFFSLEKMVTGYERVYKRILEEIEYKKNKQENDGSTSEPTQQQQ